MSGKLTDAVWRVKLERSEREVLLVMCGHADNNGSSCFPSVGLISWETDLSKRQVQRCLKSLKAMGVLEATDHQAGGRGHTVHYTIDLTKAPSKPAYIKGDISAVRGGVKGDISDHIKGDIFEIKGDKSDAQMSPIEGVKGDISTQERVTFETIKGDISDIKGDAQMSPEPSIEPPKEPPDITPPFIPPRRLKERLTIAVAAEAISRYSCFDDWLEALWGYYPRKGRADKADVRLIAKGIPMAEWDAVILAVDNYAHSSVVVDRNAVMNLTRWLGGEAWGAYVDGPIIDTPKEVRDGRLAGTIRAGDVGGERRLTDTERKRRDGLKWAFGDAVANQIFGGGGGTKNGRDKTGDIYLLPSPE